MSKEKSLNSHTCTEIGSLIDRKSTDMAMNKQNILPLILLGVVTCTQVRLISNKKKYALTKYIF